MFRDKRFLMLSAITCAAFAAGAVVAVAAQEAPANAPARLEKVEGSPFPRVVLTEQAVKRLSIQTEALREEVTKRWTVLSGQVELPSGESPALVTPEITGSVAVTGESGQRPLTWIKVPLEAGSDRPSSQVLIVVAGENDEEGDTQEDNEFAKLFGVDEATDGDDDDVVVVVVTGEGRSDLHYKARAVQVKDGTTDNGRYFELLDAGREPVLGDQALVAMPTPESGKKAKVVPYSAVIYDEHGDSWLYTNPEPLVFVRHKIAVERVLGDVAILLDGPPPGTKVVAIGAAELMGVELKIGH